MKNYQKIIKINEKTYVSRPCEISSFKCDCCDLQSQCSISFNNLCDIIRINQVWMEISEKNLNIIRE